jgi:hypothetical protein
MNKGILIVILLLFLSVLGGVGYVMTRPVDCKVSEWGTWEACDSSGNRLRKRTIIEQPKNNGKECPPLIERDVSTCPVDCKVSEWGGWGACTNGIKKRSRSIITPAKNSGTSCPVLNDETGDGCPVDCKTSAWSPWTCSRQNYEKIRTRTMTEAARNGGQCILKDTSSCLFTINHPSTNKPWVDKPVNPANNYYNSSKTLAINHPNGVTAMFAITPFTDVSDGYMLVNTNGTKTAVRHAWATLWNLPLVNTSKSVVDFVWKFEKQTNGAFIIRSDYRPDASKPAWVVGWDIPADEIKIMPQDGNTIAWKIDNLYV